ncbi:hypothetical protein [Stella sp.]|uniref:hypothetical protein n=1 Tax=Stella sp. TaxID=2912054 RepID=UPI0035ADBF30
MSGSRGSPVARYRRLRRVDDRRNATWAASDAAILAVRHPLCQAGFHDGYLAWLECNFATIRRRFRLALLPCPDIDLGGIRVVVTWLQDPIAEWSPGGLARAVALVDRGAGRGIATVNHPARLAHSGKHETGRRLAAAGIRTPRSLPVDAASAATVRAALPGRILIREDGGHRRPSLLLGAGEAIDPAALIAFRHPIAVEFVDTRGPDGLFRKMRCVTFGDRTIAVHRIASRAWEVRGERKLSTPDLRAEEADYLARPPPPADLFRRGRAALGLDVVAFDYGQTPDGGIVVWEANPYPFIPVGDRAPALLYRDQAVHRCYGAMAGLHLDRAGLSVPGAIEMLRHYGAPGTDRLLGRLRMPVPPGADGPSATSS